MQNLTFFENLKVIGILYLLSIGIMYYLSKRTGGPIILPGDIYKTRNGRRTYIPTGGSIIMTIALYYVLKILVNKFGA